MKKERQKVLNAKGMEPVLAAYGLATLQATASILITHKTTLRSHSSLRSKKDHLFV